MRWNINTGRGFKKPILKIWPHLWNMSNSEDNNSHDPLLLVIVLFESVGRTLTSFGVLRTSAGLSVQSSRLDDRRISLELIGGWLFALGGLRTTTGLSSWELSRCPGSDLGVRRRWRRLGAGFTGSPSDDGVSAGPLSVSVSSEGSLLFAAATIEPPLVSFTPFSTNETEKKLCRSETTRQKFYYRIIFSLSFCRWFVHVCE